MQTLLGHSDLVRIAQLWLLCVFKRGSLDSRSTQQCSWMKPALLFNQKLKEAFHRELLKTLINAVSRLQYECRRLVFIFGSLCNVRRSLVRGLQMTGMPRMPMPDVLFIFRVFYVLFEQKYRKSVSVCVCVWQGGVMPQVKRSRSVWVYEDLAGHTSRPWLLGWGWLLSQISQRAGGSS